MPRELELRELVDADPVNPFGNRDLSMFAVSDIAPENTGAALPTHSITGTPAQADPGGDRRRAPRLALACFARRAPRQSLSTGHVLYPHTRGRYPTGLGSSRERIGEDAVR